MCCRDFNYLLPSWLQSFQVADEDDAAALVKLVMDRRQRAGLDEWPGLEGETMEQALQEQLGLSASERRKRQEELKQYQRELGNMASHVSKLQNFVTQLHIRQALRVAAALRRSR